MERDLMDLLEFQEVLTAVASTRDGLVVASAGLMGDDAEAVAAAGSAVVDAAATEPGPGATLAVELDGAVLHVAGGQELMLVVLAEPSARGDQLGPLLHDALERVEGAIGD